MVAVVVVLVLLVVAPLGALLWFGAGREGRLALFRLVSRIFVSGERRPPTAALREGGLGHLPPGLYELMVRRRKLEAAVHTLQKLAPAYHETFESPSNDIPTDRRHQALRRDFEDAVIHVTHALDGWCEALDWLDDEANERLQAAGPIPDVPALLERFPWLPREVHEIGHLHFSSDEPLFEKALFELDAALWRVEEALTRKSPGLYR